MAAGGDPPRLPVAVVTGANTGIGFHVAGQLAAKGYDVVLACRNKERGESALSDLKIKYGGDVSARVDLLDLASFASVRAFAAGLAERHARLELLVCNAGLNSASVDQAPAAQLSADGVDVLYQTNFLSHFLLTLLLLPLLRAARGRVVSVSSVVHRGASRDNLEVVRRVREPYISLYGLSKLAQISATAELYQRFGGGDGVAFHTVNPGGVASDIWREYPAWQRMLFSAILIQTETAAKTVVQACVCEEGEPPSAPAYWNGYFGAARNTAFEYWSPLPAGGTSVPSSPSDAAQDPAFAKRVWDESIEALRAAGVAIGDDGIPTL